MNVGQTAGEGQGVTAADEEITGWPREFIADEGQVIVYQPQFDEWRDFTTLAGKAAFSVQLDDSEEPLYGALYFEAQTDVDKGRDEVLLDDIKITNIHIPDVDDALAGNAENVARKIIQEEGAVIISLDGLVADLEADSQDIREVDINLEPPPIFYSDQPAIMLGFLGEPSFKPVEGADDLMFAVNTNWDLLLDLPSSTYYLLSGDNWMETDDPLQGSWENAEVLPESLNQLPDDEWADVKEHIPGESAEQLPLVFVATEPSELIVTDGEPQFGLISGTRLMHVTNTDSDLFLDTQDKKFYFLTAGRWFRAERLQGPWSAASADLPDEFRKIPEDHDTSEVLISVPGTEAAEAAALLASVPQKVTVSRKQATASVVYEGEPEFVEIRGTSPVVSYAINSPNDVFLASGLYYALVDGIWFVASTPTGPWAVAVNVDQAIYSIPEDNPKHNATYVKVYDSTPESVVVGSTSGYSGSYVAATGVLMFGLGVLVANAFDDHGHRHYHYRPHYHGYGSGVRYRFGRGYTRGARPALYGPYGGIAARAVYDPIAGRYHRRSIIEKPHVRNISRSTHYTYIDRSVSNTIISAPYASWGDTVIRRGDRWEQADHRRHSKRGIHVDNRVTRIKGDKHLKGSTKKHKNNLFVGKDGQIYRADKSGVSKHRAKGGWKKSQVKLDRKEQKIRKNRMQGTPKERLNKKTASKTRKDRKGKKFADKSLQDNKRRHSDRKGKKAADNTMKERKKKQTAGKSSKDQKRAKAASKTQKDRKGKKSTSKVRKDNQSNRASGKTRNDRKGKQATGKSPKDQKRTKATSKAQKERKGKQAVSKTTKAHKQKKTASKTPQKHNRKQASGRTHKDHKGKNASSKKQPSKSGSKNKSAAQKKANKKCPKNNPDCRKK